VAILGENEIERGEVTIKHLATRQQVVQAQAGAGETVKRMLEMERG
jgi:histidyl-tRNA synthetase